MSKFSNLALDSRIGVQKIHSKSSVRLGGISIFLSIIITKLFFVEATFFYWVLILSILPLFFVGFIEDVFQSCPIKYRIIGIIITSLLLIFFTDTYVNSIEIKYLDRFFQYTPVAILFTLIGFAAITNAWNFLDGLNGLASGMGVISLTMMSILAFKNNHYEIFNIFSIFVLSILGFWLVNIITGKIFLGDSGSYLIGILVGWSGVKLTNMGSNISEWLIFVIIIYPAFELIFSIFRRIYFLKSPFYPDNIHLHSLLYSYLNSKYAKSNSLNTISSFILLFFGTIPGFICTFYEINYPNYYIIILVFISLYLIAYFILLNFNNKKGKFS